MTRRLVTGIILIFLGAGLGAGAYSLYTQNNSQPVLFSM